MKPDPESTAAPPTRYRVGERLFDAEAGTLSRDGTLTPLPRLSLALLLALVRRAPQLVSQAELMAAVWGEAFVSDETLQQRVKLVRKALGDDGEAPRYIATVRGRGYRLIAPVMPEPAPAAASPPAPDAGPRRRRVARWGAGLVALLLLALSALRGWHGDGAAERHASPVAAANELYRLGREHYLRYRTEDNARAIQLFREALAEDPDYAEAYAGLSNALSQSAYQFDGPESLGDDAVQAADRAVALAPDLAEAYKARGLAYAIKGWFHKAIVAYHQAIRLKPDYPEAISNMAFLHRELGQLDEALYWHLRALALDPDSAGSHLHIAQTYQALDQPDRALRWYRQALALKPGYPLARRFYSGYLLSCGEYAAALREAQALARAEPGYAHAIDAVADAYHYLGDREAAQRHYRAARDRAQGRAADSARLRLALLQRQEGQAGAEAVLEAVAAGLRQRFAQGDEDPSRYARMALIAAARERKDEAYFWLERAVTAGWLEPALLAREPHWQGLRAEARFQRLQAQVGERVQALRVQARRLEQAAGGA